ncbi:MAG: hypothetical protein IJN95_01385, partial [Clostridia bacterium]|nr:hypothetical protein [Clostridia bacterium]
KILKSVDFSSIEAQNAANTTVLASILTKSEQKSTVLKRGSGLTAHPNLKCKNFERMYIKWQKRKRAWQSQIPIKKKR